MLPGVAASLGRVVALVTDSGLARTPVPAAVEAALRGAGLSVRLRFDQVEANPSGATAERLAEEVRQSGADLVVAVGGGSVIDAAKAASMLATNMQPGRTSALAFEGKNLFTRPPLPLLAVPTTCGTGSEVTWVSVLTDASQRRKFSVKGDLMFPSAAIVDSHVLHSLPPKLIAYTGVDALTHALEATLCAPGISNPVSDTLASEAAALLLTSLRAAVKGDEAALEASMRGSTLAGLAFGNADVGAVHCISETIGGLYGVPHGLGNAIFLHPVLRDHLRRDDGLTRGGGVRRVLAGMARRTGCEKEGAEGMLAAVAALVRDLNIPGFSSLGITQRDWPLIAQLSVKNGSNASNTLGPLTQEDYLRILEAAG